ncbi:MAG: DPP IV N-terminal domain-containing protein [Gemmatimonadaceae bacterium]
MTRLGAFLPLTTRDTVIIGILVCLCATPGDAQDMRATYERAARFLPNALDSLVLHSDVQPHWLHDSSRFWYRTRSEAGKRFMLVDPARGTRDPAFDHDRLAAALQAATHTPITGAALPFDSIAFVSDDAVLRVRLKDQQWSCDIAAYRCAADAGDSTSADSATAAQVRSPDGRWLAFLRHHDLYIRSTHTGEEIRLTSDGAQDYDYVGALPSPIAMIRAGRQDIAQPVAAVWSPDSRRILTYRMDRRSAQRLSLVQNVPPKGVRPITFTYVYALPGDVGVAQAEPVIVDIMRRRMTPVAVDPVPQLYYGGPSFRWAKSSDRVWFSDMSRGDKRMRLYEIDAATGRAQVLLADSADTQVNPFTRMLAVVGDGREFVWASERDGWNHLYLLDKATGKTRQLTRGNWVVRELLGVDEAARVVYFTAGGREPGRDPYLRHVYRVNLDGSGITLLTPEDADHAATLSPDKRWLVDSYSRVDLPPVAVLRLAADGHVVRELEHADISRLQKLGWTTPERFAAKARDGKTDIYGVIWRPSNFDSTRKYPVIEQIYTGPHGFHTPKSFQAGASRTWPGDQHIRPLAELGFIVVMVDGLGTGGRSKAFRDYSYRNLGDGGIDDHISWMRSVATRYSSLDLTRVGIFGHSAGGYDSMHAMLTHPQFYKVAVSTSGNHDQRLDKASWNEAWMGFPVDSVYAAQSNVTMAPLLQGKVLLMGGDLDENVPPAAMLQLVNALIKANKNFDMLTVPNRNHGLDDDPYVIRRRWDYFVEHLMGATPPTEFDIRGRVTR